MNQFYPGYPQSQQTAPYGNMFYPNQAFGNIPRPMANYTQPLTDEEMKQLTQRAAIESWQVTATDQLKARCTHKRNGIMTLVEEGDSNGNPHVRCTICGETFHMCDLDSATMNQITESMLDALQTIKAIYVDAPDSLITQYFQILPLLKKAPALWDRAVSNMRMYENGVNNVAPIMPGVSAFSMVNNMMVNPYQFQQPMAPQTMFPGYAPQQQPYMAGPQQTQPQGASQYVPQMYQQPVPPQMYQPMQGGYPQQMGYDPALYQQNAFAYGAPQQMPPQMQNGAMQQPPMAPNPGVPGMPQQTQQQQVAPETEVVQTKSFTV